MKHKIKIEFTSSLKTAPRDKYLSLASIDELKQFVPKFDLDKDIDLLPIAANAFVCNRFNKNGDGIDGHTAVKIAKQFVNRPINLNHKRHQTCGVILSYAFSEFGTDSVLNEEQVNELVASNKPFNVVLGGVLWKIVNEDLTDLVEESNDPDSEHYSKISMSWEVGFSEYDLVLVKGKSRNLEDGEVISDPKRIAMLEASLKQSGGSGKIDGDTFVYRLAKNDIYPLGIGLTDKPAADVQGIAVQESQNTLILENNDDASAVITTASSQEQILNVNNSEAKTKTNMKLKLKNLQDLTDEVLKEVTASEISDFISEQVTQALAQKEKEQKELVEAQKLLVEEAKAKSDELVKSVEQANQEKETLKATLEEVNKKLNDLVAAEQEREKVAKFSARMSDLDETFKLEKEEREVLVADIKDLSDEDFDKYKTKLSVLLKNKVAKASEEVVTPKVDEAASQTTVAQVIENGEKEKVQVPNTASVEPTLADKMRAAFSTKEGFVISV